MNNPDLQQRWQAAFEAHQRRRRLLMILAVSGVVLAGAFAFLHFGMPSNPLMSAPSEVVADEAVAVAEVEPTASNPSPARSTRSRAPARAAAASVGQEIDLTGLPHPDASVTGRPEVAPETPSAERPPHLGPVVELGVTSPAPPRSVAARLQNRDEIVRLVRERYPAHLRHGGYGGTVVVSMFVDEAGRVQEARVTRPSGFAELNAAGLEIARSMRFSPAQRMGVISSTRVEIPLVFRP